MRLLAVILGLIGLVAVPIGVYNEQSGHKRISEYRIGKAEWEKRDKERYEKSRLAPSNSRSTPYIRDPEPFIKKQMATYNLVWKGGCALAMISALLFFASSLNRETSNESNDDPVEESESEMH